MNSDAIIMRDANKQNFKSFKTFYFLMFRNMG